MNNTKIVGGFKRRLSELGMGRVRLYELVAVGAISGLGKQALFVQQRQNTHRFLDQVDCRLQV